MRKASIVLVLALMLFPTALALDLRPPVSDPPVALPVHHWRPPVDDVVEESPWWERTEFDQDRNGLSDVLDPYALMDREDAIPVDVTLSFSRDILEGDLTELQIRGFTPITVMDIIDGIALQSVPSARLFELLCLDGAVFVEPLGIPVLFSDIATPTVRAKGSDMYSPEAAWELGFTGKGVSLAVIDTGIDDEHPSLSGKFLAGVDMTKPDNLPFLFPQDGTYNPDDIQGHGSTCSGIATGTGAPEGEYQGTAPDARLVDIRIGTRIGYAPGEFWAGSQTDPHIKDGTIRGINWGIENHDSSWPSGGECEGIDIFSLSWGVDIGMDSDGTDQYSRLLDAAVEAGVIVVNAAGNDGPDNTGFTALSASSKAIIVAATDDMNTLEHEDDVVAFYSSRGPRTDNGDGDPYDELKPDIAAPGTNISNLQPDTTRITGDASQNGYGARGSGTSYATPLIAGVVALVLEANPDLEGQNDIVKEIFRYTAERKKPAAMTDLDPFWEPDFGWGVVDAYNSVRLALTVEDPSSIEPVLQAHITNLSGAEARPFFKFNTTSTVSIGGLAWSRNGDFERVEYSVDGGPWDRITEQTTEAFNPWKVEISGLSNGLHKVSVRTVSGSKCSLQSFIEVNVSGPGDRGGGGIGGAFLFPLLIAAAAVIAVGVFIYYKRSRPKA